jgi:peptidoglycan/xylan/chitin deacetylase (PgdA/CDA1 family)
MLRYSNSIPSQWGESINGITTNFHTEKKEIALTFDACGSHHDGFDKKLIQFLIKEKIPATLFINARWIDKNNKTFKKLAANPLFEIENHGLQHKPCSVNGASAYGLAGTASVPELVQEVEGNAKKIESITGRKPKFFRSGTAYYDDVAVSIITSMGYTIAGYSVLGDAGATFPAKKVKAALLSATPGSIVICHMNHPEKETAEGVIAAIPRLKRQGFTFVTLEQVLMQGRFINRPDDTRQSKN